MSGANNYHEWKTIIFVATACCNTDFSARERRSTGARAHACSSLLWSISENVDAALCLPSFSSLALLPPTVSVLESAVRQQPAHHEYKKRQTSKLRKKKKSQHRLGQAQGTQAVQRQAGSEHSASHKDAFSCRTGGKNIKKEEKGFSKRRGASGDLLERHRAACGGMKCSHIAPPMESHVLFLLLHEKLTENPQLDAL